MIGLPRGVGVYVYGEPVDMRKQYDSLSVLVTTRMEKGLTSGDLFVFVSRNRKRSKILYFDGTGLCLWSKRMDKGHFAAPWVRGGRMELTLSELALFAEGSEEVTKRELSPPLLRKADLRVSAERKSA